MPALALAAGTYPHYKRNYPICSTGDEQKQSSRVAHHAKRLNGDFEAFTSIRFSVSTRKVLTERAGATTRTLLRLAWRRACEV